MAMRTNNPSIGSSFGSRHISLFVDLAMSCEDLKHPSNISIDYDLVLCRFLFSTNCKVLL